MESTGTVVCVIISEDYSDKSYHLGDTICDHGDKSCSQSCDKVYNLGDKSCDHGDESPSHGDKTYDSDRCNHDNTSVNSDQEGVLHGYSNGCHGNQAEEEEEDDLFEELTLLVPVLVSRISYN